MTSRVKRSSLVYVRPWRPRKHARQHVCWLLCQLFRRTLLLRGESHFESITWHCGHTRECYNIRSSGDVGNAYRRRRRRKLGDTPWLCDEFQILILFMLYEVKLRHKYGTTRIGRSMTDVMYDFCDMPYKHSMFEDMGMLNVGVQVWISFEIWTYAAGSESPTVSPLEVTNARTANILEVMKKHLISPPMHPCSNRATYTFKFGSIMR